MFKKRNWNLNLRSSRKKRKQASQKGARKKFFYSSYEDTFKSNTLPDDPTLWTTRHCDTYLTEHGFFETARCFKSLNLNGVHLLALEKQHLQQMGVTNYEDGKRLLEGVLHLRQRAIMGVLDPEVIDSFKGIYADHSATIAPYHQSEQVLVAGPIHSRTGSNASTASSASVDYNSSIERSDSESSSSHHSRKKRWKKRSLREILMRRTTEGDMVNGCYEDIESAQNDLGRKSLVVNNPSLNALADPLMSGRASRARYLCEEGSRRGSDASSYSSEGSPRLRRNSQPVKHVYPEDDSICSSNNKVLLRANTVGPIVSHADDGNMGTPEAKIIVEDDDNVLFGFGDGGDDLNGFDEPQKSISNAFTHEEFRGRSQTIDSGSSSVTHKRFDELHGGEKAFWMDDRELVRNSRSRQISEMEDEEEAEENTLKSSTEENDEDDDNDNDIDNDNDNDNDDEAKEQQEDEPAIWSVNGTGVVMRKKSKRSGRSSIDSRVFMVGDGNDTFAKMANIAEFGSSNSVVVDENSENSSPHRKNHNFGLKSLGKKAGRIIKHVLEGDRSHQHGNKEVEMTNANDTTIMGFGEEEEEADDEKNEIANLDPKLSSLFATNLSTRDVESSMLF
eukprot:m.12598 g.12598  ORF g.12598 m.12598 type:complete len:618 (-) comp4024_c0_seq1:189-2042(-)